MIEYTCSREKPPVYQACVDKFGVNWNRGIIFTYGDTIHCKYKVPEQKIAHELIHVVQQTRFGAVAWWEKYLEDVGFRLSQEIEAYSAEIIWINDNIRDLNIKRERFDKIVADLSGYIYGHMVSPEKAKQLLNLLY
jgi:hypothetical protein